MYAYFDDTKRFWNKLCIIYLLTFPCYIVLRFLHLPVWLALLCVLIIEIIAYIAVIQFTVNTANTHMKEMEEILYEECNPTLFEEKVKHLFEKKVRNRTQQCILNYELAISYLAQNRDQDALQVLENIHDDIALLTYDKRWPMYVLQCYLYIQLKQEEKAYKMLKESERCFQKTKTRTTFPAIPLDHMRMYMQYHLEHGDMHTYRDALKHILKEQEHTNLYENMLYYELFMIAKACAAYKEEIMCAYYLVKHGGQLAISEEAKKSLERTL